MATARCVIAGPFLFSATAARPRSLPSAVSDEKGLVLFTLEVTAHDAPAIAIEMPRPALVRLCDLMVPHVLQPLFPAPFVFVRCNFAGLSLCLPDAIALVY